MSSSAEGQFKLEGSSFYTKTWTPSGTIKAKLIFVHGFSEHINRYNDFFPQLAAQGIQVLSWDQRGWGKSVTKPAEKGLTGPTSRVIADVAAFVKDKLPSDEPIFVMGHSMGGGEVLTLAADPLYEDVVSQVRGWVLECPFIAFTPEEEPSKLKVVAGRMVGRILPKQQLKNEVPPEKLSRDAAVVESVRNDPLCHNTGTLEGLASLLDRTGVLSTGSVAVSKHVRSVLLAHGDDDKVCSYPAAVKWLDNQSIEDKTTKTYNGGYHQLHADLCKDEFTKDLVEWILKRSDKDSGASVESKL